MAFCVVHFLNDENPPVGGLKNWLPKTSPAGEFFVAFSTPELKPFKLNSQKNANFKQKWFLHAPAPVTQPTKISKAGQKSTS